MKAITIDFKGVCQEFNGKLGSITYYSKTFTKDQFPRGAAILARLEAAKVGVDVKNIYLRKVREFAVDQKLMETYLTDNGVSFPSINEPTIKITTI